MYSEIKSEIHEKPKRLIVEVGTHYVRNGNIVSGEPAFTHRGISSDEHYITVDISPKSAQLVKEDVGYSKDRIAPIIADGRNFPFKDNSVDELIYNNVFGDPEAAPFTQELLLEASRVLMPDGRLVITENVTPGFSVFLEEVNHGVGKEALKNHIVDSAIKVPSMKFNLKVGKDYFIKFGLEVEKVVNDPKDFLPYDYFTGPGKSERSAQLILKKIK